MADITKIDVTGVAKLIRKELAAMFPGVKFTVKSERGMKNSITARWEDGPTKAEAQEVIDRYAGYRRYTSNGFDKDEMIIHYEGRARIHYDVDYLFTKRSVTQGFVQRVIDEYFKSRSDIDWDNVWFDDKGYLVGYQDISDPEFDIERDSVRDVIYRKAHNVGAHWPSAVTEPDEKQASKFEQMADKLAEKISDKRQGLDNTLTNTARRQRMYESSLKDVQQMEQVEDKLRALSKRWVAGDVPRDLAGVKTKALVEQLVATEHSPSLHHRAAIWKAAMKAGISQQQQYETAHNTLMGLGDPDAGQETEADKLARIEREIMLTNIPGFFPTPDEVVKQMLNLSLDVHDRLLRGGRILEPSAGKGNIADLVRIWHPQAQLDVVEWNYNLRKILEAKGHNVIGDDCLELTPDDGLYDLIIMNPPFENGQDMEHVQHCFTLLKPGGRLVSIVSESCFFRKDGKYQEWRDWFDDEGGRDIDLPAGAFKDSERSTGVKTRIIILDAPEVATSTVVDPVHDELLDNSDLALLHYIWLRQEDDREQFADLGDQSRYAREADFLVERGYLDDDTADEQLYRLTDTGHQALKQRGSFHNGMFVRNVKLDKTGWLEKSGKRGWKVNVYTALENAYNDTWREEDLTPFLMPPMKDLIRDAKAASKRADEAGLKVTHRLIRLGYLKAGIVPVSERRTVVEAAYTPCANLAHDEPDGTSPYMIENQMGIAPDEDWLLTAWARRWYKECPTPKLQPKRTAFQRSGRSPLYDQYMQIKDLYPNEFVLFRVGDFYEIFGDDADQAGGLLDITVTKRGINKRGDKVQMAGFPLHVADEYIARLVELGYNVAVCDYANPTRVISGYRQREVSDLHLGGSPTSITIPADTDLKPERSFFSGSYVLNVKEKRYGWLYKSVLHDDGEAWQVYVDGTYKLETWLEDDLRTTPHPDPAKLLKALSENRTSLMKGDFKQALLLCYADDLAFRATLDVLEREPAAPPQEDDKVRQLSLF